MARNLEKTLKTELQESIEENNALRIQYQRLAVIIDSTPQFEVLSLQHPNVLESAEYLELMAKNAALHQKFLKIKAENETLGEEKEKVGQEMQQL